MKRNLLSIFGLLFFQVVIAQVGIGTTSPQAQLDISASNAANPTNFDGLLIPRVSAFPVINPTASQHGMLVFLTAVFGANSPGFYYWNQPTLAWTPLMSANSWNINGNTATSGTNFIGTTNAQDVDFRTNNLIRARLTQKSQLEFLNNGLSVFLGEDAGDADDLTNNQNVYIGYQSGQLGTTGSMNVAIGFRSLWNNTTGYSNVAVGHNALTANSTGIQNTAVGQRTLAANSTGQGNTAMGHLALNSATTANDNTAIGVNALRINNGNHNTAAGAYALEFNTSGYANTAVGKRTLLNNTTGYFNTASGYNALQANSTGYHNTASGAGALGANTVGYHNTANGMSALQLNTTGFDNTAVGNFALNENTDGSLNTAVGSYALSSNTLGIQNTANGRNSLRNNVSGNNNTATGMNAMSNNQTGGNNTASGVAAMYLNSTGSNNVATGGSALYYNTVGTYNAAFGLDALRNNSTGQHNTAVGASALMNSETGLRLTGIGRLTDVTSPGLTNGTVIGANALLNASNKVRLGAATVTTVEGQVPYSNPSDARFKFDVKENIPGLDFIMKLRPVTYRFDTRKFQYHLSKDSVDDISTAEFEQSSSIIRSGFLAQEVETAAAQIDYDFDGIHIADRSNPSDNYSLAYSQFVMPLVKAVQEQQLEISELEEKNAQLTDQVKAQKKLLADFEKRLKALETK